MNSARNMLIAAIGIASEAGGHALGAPKHANAARGVRAPAPAPVIQSYPARNIVFWAVRNGSYMTISSVPLAATSNGAPQSLFADGLLNIIRSNSTPGEKSGYFIIDASSGAVIQMDAVTTAETRIRP
ncbi:MAG TPA: hypothetical protein VIJ59_07335 [Caulobacteraceae bacterium]